jgi:hypothetical protein
MSRWGFDGSDIGTQFLQLLLVVRIGLWVSGNLKPWELRFQVITVREVELDQLLVEPLVQSPY